MKKTLILIFIFLFNSNLFANDWRTKKGGIILDEFKVNKKMVLPLDPGKWIG